MSIPDRERVAVIGGGVIGAATAYYLATKGRAVTIIDRGEFGKACSHGNCGYISPSHVLPLCGPGAIKDAIKAILRPNSPFKIRARLDLSLWSWLFKFAKNCSREKMIATAHAKQALLKSSRALYADLVKSELPGVEWSADGVLFVYQTPGEFEHYAATDQLLRNEFGLGARAIDSEELVAMEPALKPGLAGAWHYDTDAHLRPDRLMTAWKQRLTELSVEFREHCRVIDFEPTASQDRALRVIVEKGDPIAAESYVVATGAWTPLLNSQLGARVPIQPGKGYSMTMSRPQICPKYPMIFEEHRVAVTPWPSGYRLGSTMEFTGYDASLNRKRLALLRNGATLYLHEPMGKPITEEWSGFRPMSSDDLPIIGPSPRFENVYVAAGHGMLGVSMAPATGKLIAELICRELPHIEPQAYSFRRFLKTH
jgi:D-amino-acid dehydrogenase